VQENNTVPVTDPDAPFNGVPATTDIAMYEINLRAFSSSGTLQGVLPRLDSIRKLGINVLWLMPIYPIGQQKMIPPMGSPYSVRSYHEVNPEYGTLDDLKNLVRESHARGMAVILDWVANHTAWDHPWISNKSWYTQDGNGNIISPPGTNWLDVADLDYANQEMRQAMIGEMKYWITTANIDGFRCDAADFVPFDFWKQAIDSLKKLRGRKLILLAEGARPDHFTAGFQMNFSWDFLSKMKSVFREGQTTNVLSYANWYETASLPDSVRKLRFTTNHDETAWSDTPVGLFGGREGSMAAFVAAAFMGGVPLIYNGQEVGCPVKLPLFDRSPIDWTTNPAMMAEYVRLMQIRNTPAVKEGTIDYYSDSDILAFRRKALGEEVLVMINVRDQAETIAVPALLKATEWTDALQGGTVVLSNFRDFQPYQYLILRRITTFAQ
jgi:glycosidase